MVRILIPILACLFLLGAAFNSAAERGRSGERQPEIFEAPLDFFLKPESVQIDSYLLEGTRRYFYAFCYPSRYIWGATAGILINLKERLQASWYES